MKDEEAIDDDIWEWDVRDEFAKAAMIGLIIVKGSTTATAEHIAIAAYELADAMLRVRNPK